MTTRQPLAWANLNYSGDLRGRIEGQVVGPNRLGELFVILSTSYDDTSGTTTAHLNYATTSDVAGQP